jgi:hypothetical protein
VDFTADQDGETQSFDALMDWGRRFGNAALTGVSLSSDGFGSLPKFNSKGELEEYAVASPSANLDTIRRLVLQGGWKLEDALVFSTTNPASFLAFKNKGSVSLSPSLILSTCTPQCGDEEKGFHPSPVYESKILVSTACLLGYVELDLHCFQTISFLLMFGSYKSSLTFGSVS